MARKQTAGQLLRDVRKSRGDTQKTLAETLGVTEQAVYYWERDAHKPNRDAMIALRDLYGIKIEEWFRYVA